MGALGELRVRVGIRLFVVATGYVARIEWEPYPRSDGVVGDLRLLRDVESPQLGNRRDIVAYLPPSHGDGRRFAIVYMQDGQNLFDAATSNSGEWRVGHTMEELARDGTEAIVVGIASRPRDERGEEYAGRRASAYVSFVVDTVRPLVEDAFDVDGARARRGIAGSSLGAVASLFALYAHRDVFGFAGVFSPAFWWNRDDRWFDLVEEAEMPDARIYLDVGDDEGDGDDDRRRLYVDGFVRMNALLEAKGFEDDRLRAVFDRGGRHHETAWARRLPDAFRFLLEA